MPKAEIETLVGKGLEELAFSDTYLVEAKLSGKKIEVYLDSDGWISCATCQKLSRWLEAQLDKSGTYGDNYVLEVSSAGIGNPLRMLSHNIPRISAGLLILNTVREGHVRGVLKEVRDNIIVVEMEKVIRENNKNKKI